MIQQETEGLEPMKRLSFFSTDFLGRSWRTDPNTAEISRH